MFADKTGGGNWIEDQFKEDCAKHADFPAEMAPPGLEVIPKDKCAGCPIVGMPGHTSDQCRRSTEEGPEENRIDNNYLRELAAAITENDRITTKLEGSQLGYVINAVASLNFADFLTWRVEGVSNNIVRVRHPDGLDARRRVIYESQVFPDGALFATTVGSEGVPQAGDEVEILWPSCLALKCRPTLLKVTPGDDETEFDFHLNQSVNALQTSGDSDDPQPEYFYIKTWRQAGARQDHEIPIDFIPFQAKRRRLLISQPPGGWTGDGKYTLKKSDGTEGAISVVEADFSVLKVESGVTSDISADCWPRTITKGSGPGSDGMGEFTTTICLGDEDVDGNPLTPILNENITQISVTYWGQATAAEIEAATGICVPHAFQCIHSIRDWSNSDYGAPEGSAVDDRARRFLCDRMNFPEHTYEDVGGGHFEVTTENQRASGLATYNPLCLQLHGCDQFAVRTDYFTVESHLSRFLRKYTSRTNIRIYQLMPGFASYRNQRVERVAGGGPSTVGQMGDIVSPSSPAGFHEFSYFPDFGSGVNRAASHVGDFEIIEDIDGNVTLNPLRGAYWDARTDMTALVFPEVPEGGILTTVSGWLSKDDPFGVALDATSDPYESQRNHSYRMSPRITKDSGSFAGRGAAKYVKEVEAHYLQPRSDLTNTGGWIDQGDCRLKIFSVAQMIDGVFEARGVLQIRRMDLEGKSPNTVATGVVAAASVDGGLIRLEIANQEHRWSFVTGTGFDARDEVISWEGAGGFVQAESFLKVNSFHETDKTFGGTTDRCSMGDACHFSGVTIPAIPSLDENDADTDIPLHLYTVVRAIAHHGAEAANWGDEKVLRAFFSTGYFQPLEANLDLPDSEFAGTISTASVTRISPALVFTRKTQEVRPSTLAAGEYWIDPNTQNFLFSEANKGDVVNIQYTVPEKSTTYNENGVTISTNGPEFETGLPFTPFGGYDRVITLQEFNPDGSTSTVTLEETAGTPVKGEYKAISDGGADLLIQMHMDDAHKTGLLEITTGDTAADPGDAVCDTYPGYSTDGWGRKRDVVWLQDYPNGELAANIGALVGATITCERQMQVSRDNEPTLKATKYRIDEYQTIAAEDTLWKPGSGNMYIAATVIDALVAEQSEWCFLLE